MKAPTQTLAAALRQLANDIESPDGVANAAIAEAAERLEELTAQVERLDNSESILIEERDGLESVCDKLAGAIAEFFNVNFGEHTSANCPWRETMEYIQQQSLRQIQAEAGRAGYYNGFKDALIIDPPLPPATGTYATVDVFQYRIEQASRYAANQYAERVAKGKG